jgi:hypothetical protein
MPSRSISLILYFVLNLTSAYYGFFKTMQIKRRKIGFINTNFSENPLKIGYFLLFSGFSLVCSLLLMEIMVNFSDPRRY